MLHASIAWQKNGSSGAEFSCGVAPSLPIFSDSSCVSSFPKMPKIFVPLH